MKQFGTNAGDAHLRKLMQDPRYWRERDPAYVKMIQTGFKDLYDNPTPQARAAEGEAANEMGMNGQHHAQDSMVAHVTPGEIVIPLSAQTPELIQYLHQTLGQDMMKFVVGSGYEQENPTSGLPAFADTYCDRAWKRVKAKEAEIERRERELKNDPNNVALILKIGRLEGELRDLQGDLNQC